MSSNPSVSEGLITFKGRLRITRAYLHDDLQNRKPKENSQYNLAKRTEKLQPKV